MKIKYRFISTSAKLHTNNTDNYTFKLVNKYKFFGNDLRKQATKYLFDKNKIFSSDKNLSPQDEYSKQRVNLSDENKELRTDLDMAIKAKQAINKISENTTPRKSEFSGLKKTEEKYESFFDSDDELSDSNISENNSILDEKKSVNDSLQKVDNVIQYIKEELSINKNRSRYLGKSYKGKEKRKIEYSDDEESSSSKKSRTSDFIDELPKEYNPFEDLGTD